GGDGVPVFLAVERFAECEGCFGVRQGGGVVFLGSPCAREQSMVTDALSVIDKVQGRGKQTQDRIGTVKSEQGISVVKAQAALNFGCGMHTGSEQLQCTFVARQGRVWSKLKCMELRAVHGALECDGVLLLQFGAGYLVGYTQLRFGFGEISRIDQCVG